MFSGFIDVEGGFTYRTTFLNIGDHFSILKTENRNGRLNTRIEIFLGLASNTSGAIRKKDTKMCVHVKNSSDCERRGKGCPDLARIIWKTA